MSGEVSVNGQGAVMAALQKLAAQAPQATVDAIHEEGLALDAEAVRLAPVDTGRLRQSHYVKKGTVEGDPERIGFGAEYALPVHEDLAAHHEVGQAKFLEQPWDERKVGLVDRLAVRIADNIAGALRK